MNTNPNKVLAISLQFFKRNSNNINLTNYMIISAG